ncbi:DUF6252 family protein [Rufibacter hautae]|uniref:Uncharacterized protein n=1 Tax=Rufibacter hautae TaxID=2595005 RepID=A0A5B6TEZ4_9BACT|nr:DUF6252 family protein [Rufibacter hautae]KAA3438766.1 hypothetical protein FOA19_16250 [Rufibacter hautae]
MRRTSLLLLSLLFWATDCELFSDAEKLPKATQHGADTMAAEVNGEPWRSRACWGCIEGGGGLEVNHNQDYFSVRGEQPIGAEESLLEVQVQRLTATGRYPLKERTFKGSNTLGSFATFYDGTERGNPRYYLTTSTSQGEVHVTKLDTVSRIVSGTFWFEAP